MRRFWTEKDITFLRGNYSDTSAKDLARQLHRTESSIYAKANLFNLRKDKDYLSEKCRLRAGHGEGKLTQFKPGHSPHNKGKKGWCAGGRSVKTRFKPGNRPQTWAPVGSKRLTKDGILQQKISDTGYSPRDWKSVHSILWERYRGPIPPGHIVVFKNRDTKDIRIKNLECISRAENMRRNTVHNLPEEMVDVIRRLGVLNRHINKGLKNEK